MVTGDRALGGLVDLPVEVTVTRADPGDGCAELP